MFTCVPGRAWDAQAHSWSFLNGILTVIYTSMYFTVIKSGESETRYSAQHRDAGVNRLLRPAVQSAAWLLTWLLQTRTGHCPLSTHFLTLRCAAGSWRVSVDLRAANCPQVPQCMQKLLPPPGSPQQHVTVRCRLHIAYLMFVFQTGFPRWVENPTARMQLTFLPLSLLLLSNISEKLELGLICRVQILSNYKNMKSGGGQRRMACCQLWHRLWETLRIKVKMSGSPWRVVSLA